MTRRPVKMARTDVAVRLLFRATGQYGIESGRRLDTPNGLKLVTDDLQVLIAFPRSL